MICSKCGYQTEHDQKYCNNCGSVLSELSQIEDELGVDWDTRTLCSDGSCIGILDENGTCRECGKDHPTYSREAKRRKQEATNRIWETPKEIATKRTAEAESALQEIRDLLMYTLDKDHALSWEALKRTADFPDSKPTNPQPKSLPLRPNPHDPQFIPNLLLIDKIIGSRRSQKEAEALRKYKRALNEWEETITKATKENASADSAYDKALQDWEKRRQEFLAQQEAHNQIVDRLRTAYEERDQNAIKSYFEFVLSASKYPDTFPSQYNLDYNSHNKVLVVEYSLPSPATMPRIKEVKYIQNRNEFREAPITDSQLQRLYDDAIYKIALRTIYELFQADRSGNLTSIVFNGWVRSTDRATGKETIACILSVHAQKEEFMALNLAQVDPKAYFKACFKKLKGVFSSQLHSLTPVAPILQLNRQDSRFINPCAVASSLDDSTNLAAMDWTEFEHLIREFFEYEFSKEGGEVKVTQASRDGGVDAIAFDPDPIRGGKIIIQAKRYTNTVGVAAVRDLYGTVVNEGANKGILVTTSDYGPDAYEFANGKPLTLLNGANLLHLLAKHGHKARIDLKEENCTRQ